MEPILIDKKVMVPMRDEVQMATDVYRLEGVPPAPVLVARTPYDKERAVGGGTLRSMATAPSPPSHRATGHRTCISTTRPAINRVFHDTAHPSRLILPIVERETGE